MPRHAPLRCLLAFNLAAFAANITTNADPATLASAISTATIPAVLAVPADQTLTLTLTAQGVQIYKCLPVAGNPSRYEWAFQAPEADLFDARGQKVGHHFAGPTWELAAGGKVVGHVKAKANSPDGKGVPWLLLEAVPGSATGGLVNVQTIRRIDTNGGQPPVEPADASKANQEARTKYTAAYQFYGAKP